MSKKNETAVLLLSLVVTLALLAAGLWWVINRSGIKLPGVAGNPSNPGETTPAESNAPKQPVSDRISAGEKLLISSQ
ncbi:MAG TPA: receptor ligand binding family protein, partial [Coleofasciculaceae cyanobacterium]